MVIPTMPLYAMTMGKGELGFDFYKFNQSIGVGFDFKIGSLEKAGQMITGYPMTATGEVALPFWEMGNPGSFSNHPSYHKNWNNMTNTGASLEGYLIEGWYSSASNRVNGIRLENLGKNRYPVNSDRLERNIYYAALKADTNKKYTYEESHTTISGIPTPSALNIDTSMGGKGYLQKEQNVLKDIQVNEKTAPGYKLITSGANAPKVEVEEDGNYRLVTLANPVYIGDNHNIQFDLASHQVNGKMPNKNVRITYQYEVDNTKKFAIKVKHDLPGILIDHQESQLREYAVGTLLENLPNHERIQPDINLITKRPGEISSRYLMDDSVYPNGVVIQDGNGQDFANPHTDSTLLDPSGIQTDSMGKIRGAMINQALTVTYKYKINPQYYMTLNVVYRNTNGEDITDIVAEKLENNGITLVTDINQTNTVKPMKIIGTSSGSMLSYKVNINPTDTKYRIYAPILDGYKLNPDIEPAEHLAYEKSRFLQVPKTGWSETTPWYTLDVSSQPEGSATVIVTYDMDTDTIVKTSFEIEQGGELKIGNEDFDANKHTIRFLKQNRIAGTYDLEISSTQLPTPKANDGYRFVKWQWRDISNTGSQLTDVSFPLQLTNLVDVPDARILFKAVFVEDPSHWNTYYFASGDTRIDVSQMERVKRIPNVLDGVPTEITWSNPMVTRNLDRVRTVGIPVDSEVRWYDSSMQEMNENRIMSAGETFTAYVVSNVGNELYTPEAEGRMDSSTGIPMIRVNPNSPKALNPNLEYIVTDTRGKVVQALPGSALLPNGDIASVYPGYIYNVQTAPIGTAIIGNMVPNIGLSDKTRVIIPAVANAPVVNPDPNHSGRAMITIQPTAPDTEYALYTPNGNTLVVPYKKPTPNAPAPVVFENLPDNTEYMIVPRKIGDTSNQAPTVETGQSVNTGNQSPLVIPHQLSIVKPSSLSESILVEIDGTPMGNIDRMQIEEGKNVQITAPMLDNQYNALEKIVTLPKQASHSPSGVHSTIVFAMPNKDVVVQPVYTAPGVIWNKNTPPNTTQSDYIIYEGSASKNNVIVTRPSIEDAGIYRIRVNRKNVSEDIRTQIQSMEVNPFTSEWLVSVIVEKWDNTEWKIYEGDIKDLSLRLYTGMLQPTVRHYHLYEMASDSNASRVSGEFEQEWEEVGKYTGSFTIPAKNNTNYIFGYTMGNTYTITLKSNRLLDFKKQIVIGHQNSLEEYSPLYQPDIVAQKGMSPVDTEGLTWSYKGLSKDANLYIPYDIHEIITEDREVYIYFENDALERTEAITNLHTWIAKVGGYLGTHTLSSQKSEELAMELANARDILDKTVPRKSTTPEIQNAVYRLKLMYEKITGESISPGGNAGGGSGGLSGGTIPKKNIKEESKVIHVGIDGDWEFIGENRWAFRLKTGKRVTGWYKLTYHHKGVFRTEWYYFDENHLMGNGWFYDIRLGKWYYLSEKHDGFFGHMVTGWHYDSQDNKWYYLNPSDGAMLLGWQQINGKWYYLNDKIQGANWKYEDGKWSYIGGESKPYGAMYSNEKTPDGYYVNIDGVWEKE